VNTSRGTRSDGGALGDAVAARSGAGRRRTRHRAARRVVVLVAGVTIAGSVVAVTSAIIGRTHRQPSAVGCVFPADSAAGTYTITPEQAQNAAIIAAVALRKGMADHAVTVALAASMQETHLRNLAYGDLDSVGLFQQRPSQGWGTPAEIMDPDYAASAFYEHLDQVSGWQTMAVTAAAQLVQHSAAPDAYANWEAEARALASALTGEVPAGLSCRLHGFGGSTPPPSALGQAAATEMGAPLLGVALAAKTGWEVAAWCVAHAYNYHLSSVSFGGWTWTVASGKWALVARPGQGAAADIVTAT